MKYKINTVEEFEHVISEQFSSLLKYDAILLVGDLGLGKTTFSKYFAKLLGIRQHIKSPTFSIISTYSLNPNKEHPEMKKKFLHHCDLYRIADEDELYEIGFEDLFNPDSLLIIEWADLFMDAIVELCPNHVIIKLYFEGEERILEIAD